jgi:uncharacterized protein YgiM (DUF1202 family)
MTVPQMRRAMLSSLAGRTLAASVLFPGAGLAVGVAALAAPASASAQTTTATSELAPVVVAADDALLRCGSTKQHYAVAKLEKGQILAVDSESGEWRRVLYPAGTTAFVPADQAQFSESAMTATLAAPSGLKAANAIYGLRGSWKPLLDEPLPAGTRLTVTEVIKGEDGQVAAYRVVAPSTARAWVQADAVRKATDQEVQAYAARMRSMPAPAAPPAAPAFTPIGAAPSPVAAKPQPEKKTDTSLVEPMVKPGTTAPSTTPSSTTPPPNTSVPIGERPAPAAVPPADGGEHDQAKPTTPAPPERPIAKPDELDTAFRAVLKQPSAEAEVQELSAEFQRTLDAMPDTPENKRTRTALQRRMEALKVKVDIQTAIRRAKEVNQSVSEDSKKLAARLADLDRVRAYTIIGRLAPSTIYDGVKLPLMYRVVSVGSDPSRTLGYLKPGSEPSLDSKVGLVVGVVGDSMMDRSLRLNIITADHVDVLGPAEASAAPLTGDK